jgi:hypothetical protein
MAIRNPFKETPYIKVEDKNRFYYMLQQMQSNRWKITGIVLFLFFFIIFGINMAVMFKIEIAENWKEMLLILFGAFVGNLNKVVDYWFNSEDRDKMLIQKVDEEDGQSLSNVGEFPETKEKTQSAPIVIYRKETSPVVEQSLPVIDDSVITESEDNTESETPSERPDDYNPEEGEDNSK